jgi:hypothetical protein
MKNMSGEDRRYAAHQNSPGTAQGISVASTVSMEPFGLRCLNFVEKIVNFGGSS